MGRLNRCARRGYRLEYEANTAARCDGRAGPGLMEFLPQASHMGIDDIRARIEMHIPNFFVELTARDCLTSSQHQVLVYFELHRGAIHVFGVASDATGQ